MGGVATLRERWETMNRPVSITVDLPAQTVAGVERLRRDLGLSLEDAVAEAVGEWTVRRRQVLHRDRHARLEQQIRQTGLDNVRVSTYAKPMKVALTDMKLRRMALGLTQPELAKLAECSKQAVRLYESGSVPRKSDVIGKIERALYQAEADAQ